MSGGSRFGTLKRDMSIDEHERDRQGRESGYESDKAQRMSLSGTAESSFSMSTESVFESESPELSCSPPCSSAPETRKRKSSSGGNGGSAEKKRTNGRPVERGEEESNIFLYPNGQPLKLAVKLRTRDGEHTFDRNNVNKDASYYQGFRNGDRLLAVNGIDVTNLPHNVLVLHFAALKEQQIMLKVQAEHSELVEHITITFREHKTGVNISCNRRQSMSEDKVTDVKLYSHGEHLFKPKRKEGNTALCIKYNVLDCRPITAKDITDYVFEVTRYLGIDDGTITGKEENTCILMVTLRNESTKQYVTQTRVTKKSDTDEVDGEKGYTQVHVQLEKGEDIKIPEDKTMVDIDPRLFRFVDIESTKAMVMQSGLNPDMYLAFNKDRLGQKVFLKAVSDPKTDLDVQFQMIGSPFGLKHKQHVSTV